MSNCMDLIPREELQHECRGVGRQIETTILSRHPPMALKNEELDRLFQPLVDHVEEQTRIAVSRELDEEHGRQQDQKEQNDRDDLISERRARLSEKCGKFTVYSEDGSHSRTFEMTNAGFIQGLRTARDDNWDGIIEWNEEPSMVDDRPDDDFIEYDEDDYYWQDYLPNITVVVKSPYDQIIGLNMAGLLDYLQTYKPHPKKFNNIARNIVKYDLAMYGYYVDAIKQTYNLFFSQWKSDCQIVLQGGLRAGKVCHRSCPVGKTVCSYHGRKRKRDQI